MKKLLLLIMVVSLVSSASALSLWERLTADGPGNWNDPNNWNGGVPTSSTDITKTGQGVPNKYSAEILVDDAQTFGNKLRHGNNTADLSSVGPTIRIRPGGSLTSGDTPTNSYIGDSSKAKIIVEDGGSFIHDGANFTIGYAAGSHGTLTVSGTADLTNAKTLVGDEGTGILNVNEDGVFSISNATRLIIGAAAGSHGTLNVDGTANVVNVTRSYVGELGTGIINVNEGGVLTVTNRLYLGRDDGGIGTVNVEGTVSVSGNTYVGYDGTGILNIYPGGVYNCDSFSTGDFKFNDRSTINLAGDGKLVTDGDDLVDAVALIARGRFAVWGVLGGGVTAAYDGTDTTITATDPNDPMLRIPTYGAEVNTAVSSDVDLSWVNLDPNEVDGNVWVDVWFGTDMTLVQNASDPNIWEYADFDKVVDAEENTTGVTVSAPGNGQEYFWRVDTYRYGNPATDPDTPLDEGIAMPFTVNSDFPPTIVIDSPAMVTWVGGPPIPLTATVTDDGASEVIIEWDSGNESEPNIIFTNETWDPETKIATADVTVDYATNNFNVRVRATDDAGTYRSPNVVLQCRADACDAARWLINQTPGESLSPADVNDDCEFDLADIAWLALDWLYDYTIEVPTPIAP